MGKKYDPIEEESHDMACEPLGGAALAEEVAENVSDIPSDILAMAIELTLKDEREGKLIPADQVIDLVYKDLGWK